MAERLRRGLAVIPGDRLREGVLPGGPVYETYALGLHNLWSGSRWRPGAVRERARSMIDAFRVATPDELAPTATLSGGNIQKVLVARALGIADAAEHSALVAMNPTSGLDVGASSFVHEQLVRTCARGCGVVLISEDLDELLTLCDRIVVLHAGELVAEYRRGGYDRFEIGARMVGAHQVTGTRRS